MIKKTSDKEKAVTLRKEGKTYNEILHEVPVAKIAIVFMATGRGTG